MSPPPPPAAASASKKRNKRKTSTPKRQAAASATAADDETSKKKKKKKSSSNSKSPKSPRRAGKQTTTSSTTAAAAVVVEQQQQQQKERPPIMMMTKNSDGVKEVYEKVLDNATTKKEKKKMMVTPAAAAPKKKQKGKKVMSPLLQADGNHHHNNRTSSWWLFNNFKFIGTIQSFFRRLGNWILSHIPFLLVIVTLVFSNLPDDHHLDQDPPLLVAIVLVWYAIVRIWYMLSDSCGKWFRALVDPLVLSLLSVSLWCVKHVTLLAGLVLVVFSFLPEDHHLELDPPMMLAILGVWYMVQSVWSGLPNWLVKQRNDVMEGDDAADDGADGSTVKDVGGGVKMMKGIGAGNNKNNEQDDEDLTSPNTIWKKLNEMFELTYQHTGDIPLSPRLKVYVCFFSLMHLLTELYLSEPEWHDDMMRSEGSSVVTTTKNKKDELETLMLYLEMADLAYNESSVEVMRQLKDFGGGGYDLLRHDVATEPGRVGHFIAVHHQRKQVVISIKGTSSLSDVLTDLVGKAVPHTLRSSDSSTTTIRCHEGMYNAARILFDDTRHLIQHFFLPSKYSIVICGHSLGAGVGTLLGVFLKHNPYFTLTHDTNLHVYAFATPACLDYTASLDCRDYITSVVNNDDCVPRISLVTIRNLMKVFVKLDERLAQLGRSPTSSWRSTRAYLADLAKIDTDTLVTAQELLDFETEAREDDDHEHALFVPGKVVSMWLHDTTTNDNDDSSNNNSIKKTVDCRQGDGGLSTLRHIEVSTTMISDHGTANYKSTLASLIHQEHNDNNNREKAKQTAK